MPKKTPNPVPEGMHTITPYLSFKNNCNEAIAFYEKALGAKLIGGIEKTPDGRVMHSMMKVGDSNFMLSDSFRPVTYGTPMIEMWLYVDDADALFDRAVKAGCEITMQMEDAFWGDRLGQVKDPFGHIWSIATAKWELSPEEMKQREQEWMKKSGM
ncbi:MAG: glyoxalase/bleomycin resistance/extradiol dioxygenase family protein [Fibrobacter sp.]|nr:glyoxalase/bleomycin resistance/extradiol dioxygenase family protein [Fibrobacter sp.]